MRGLCRLLSFDLVTDPSTPGAYLQALFLRRTQRFTNGTRSPTLVAQKVIELARTGLRDPICSKPLTLEAFGLSRWDRWGGQRCLNYPAYSCLPICWSGAQFLQPRSIISAGD